MELLASHKLCDTCGSTLESEMPSGFCPGCLLNTVLEAGTETTATPGSQIDDYELLNEVARGGMGIVYRARQRTPSRIVALKMILPSHIGSLDALARFRGETEAAASLDHEGILPVYAVGEKDGAPFYSMKFAEGGSLASRLVAFRDKPRESATLIAKLARAVAHAHERGILHRDLKPGNVLFDGTDKPFVSDFGLAKWLERECDLTQTLAILGTPYYMAPEQTADAHSITPAADIYSLGAILFQLLTGRVPFRGVNALDVLRQAAERPAPRLRALNRRVPTDLETICLKCLEKDPAARYSSSNALADDLDRFLARRAIRAHRANAITQALRWARRNPSSALLGTAAVALLISLFLVLRPPPPQKVQARDAEKSIAVLPFESLTDNQMNAYFANGIQNDILVNLSKIADLKVIARDSVMSYRGPGRNLREISKTLGVRAVLEGSVRYVGNRVRLNVQLVDATNDAQMWAENYDREMADAFAIQSDLAFQIASALKAKLTSSETAQLKRLPTENGEAYLFYIQAGDLLASYNRPKDALKNAEELYGKAIQLDPTFALAHAGLSQVETLRNSSEELLPERRARARAHAQKALELEPDLPEGHWALGKEYYQGGAEEGDRDLVRARSEFEIAHRGLPNNAEILSMIGRLERREGKWTQSTAHLKQAASLDPNNQERWHYLCGSYRLVRNFPAAAEALDHAIALSPNSWNYAAHKALLQIFWKGDLSAVDKVRAPAGGYPEDPPTEDRFQLKLYQRKYEEAESILRDDPREDLAGTPKAFLLGEVYLVKKDKEKARANFEASLPVIERLVQAKPRHPWRRLMLAEAYAGLGRKTDAVREGKRAVEMVPETKDAQEGVALLGALARIYVMVGEPDLALPILAHSLATPGGLFVNELRLHPDWDPLRSDPRFQQLIDSPPEQVGGR